MDVPDSTTAITIGHETFDLLTIPESSTDLVKNMEDQVMGGVIIDSVADDLAMVGKFIRIAYNGVAGYTDLEIKIRRIGVNVSKLSDSSAVTVGIFKRTTTQILVDLQSTYQFLLDGMEDMAAIKLQSIATVAQEMAQVADKLAKKFDEESDRVEDAVHQTTTKKGSEETRKKKLRTEERQSEIELGNASKRNVVAEESIAFHSKQYEKASGEQAVHENHRDNFIVEAINFLAKPFLGRKLFGASHEAEARDARKAKKMHLAEKIKQQELRSKALDDILEIAKKIEGLKDDSVLADAAVTSLLSALKDLKALSNVMRQVSLFWQNLELECKRLSCIDMQQSVKLVQDRPIQERVKVYKSRGFKMSGLQYYARWVALDNVCRKYLERIKETQKEFYKYLEETPTLDEARKNVQELAKIFTKEVKEKLEATTERAARQTISLLGEIQTFYAMHYFKDNCPGQQCIEINFIHAKTNKMTASNTATGTSENIVLCWS